MNGDNASTAVVAFDVFAMAPMVGQSDLPFRRLVRSLGCTLVYSEMFLAERFASDEGYRIQALGLRVRPDDHPLVVQVLDSTCAPTCPALQQLIKSPALRRLQPSAIKLSAA
jgi:tRNA-dihydrouridine synthase